MYILRVCVFIHAGMHSCTRVNTHTHIHSKKDLTLCISQLSGAGFPYVKRSVYGCVSIFMYVWCVLVCMQACILYLGVKITAQHSLVKLVPIPKKTF